MKVPRRRFLHLAAGVAMLAVLPRVAAALDYPTRPVHIIIGFPPGGSADVVARPIAQCLAERLGHPFIIENRPGGGGNVGTEDAARARADGYTLLLVQPAAAINATLYEKVNFNFIRDIAPVSGIASVPTVMLVNPSVPVKTIPDFIAYAKAHPGKLNMASPGIGTLPHVTGELFKTMAGVDIVHVPYRGAAQALTDLLSEQVQMSFVSMAPSIQYIRSGELHALAVTTAARSRLLPDIPPMSEFLPGFEASAWFGIGAPQRTQSEIVDKLNKEINACLADPKAKAWLASLGGAVIASSPADFGKLMADDTEKWGKVVRAAHIRPD